MLNLTADHPIGTQDGSVFRRLRPDPGAPVLASAGAAFDVWFDGVATRQHGCVRFVVDGEWLYGCAEGHAVVDLQEAARRAYADLFRCWPTTRQSAPAAAVELLPRHQRRRTGGIERYRQFNAGRQQAFIEARRSAFEGSPAACALGMHGGPLRSTFWPADSRRSRSRTRARSAPIATPTPTAHARRPSRAQALADIGAPQRAVHLRHASIVGHATCTSATFAARPKRAWPTSPPCARRREPAGRAFPAGELTYTLYVRHPPIWPWCARCSSAAVGPGSSAARDAIYLQRRHMPRRAAGRDRGLSAKRLYRRRSR
jgi:chorismate lyase/3-hydroxybenzoate synthase